MKCMNCGTEIPEGQLICPGCGQEIQIVPDYNPLDDVLAAHVRGAVTETLSSEEMRRGMKKYNSERGISPRESNGRNQSGRSGNTRYNTGRNQNSRTGNERNVPTGRTGDVRRRQTGRMSPEEREEKRRRAEKKRLRAKKRRMKRLLILAVFVVLAVVIGVTCYQNSYTGQVRKGYSFLNSGEYDEAVKRFEKAISKDKKRSDAYTGLSKVYIAQNDLEKAESIFLDAILKQSSNVDIYRAAIQFYIDTKQEDKVSPLLDECSSDSVLNELSEFVSEVPEFSLNEDEEYDDIQALELTGSGVTIYYTTDKTDPTTSSKKYTEPIKLDEGETEVRAISVNKKGIPSLVAKKTFTVEFPIEDAPSVTPSTGLYENSQTIEVVVPENYEAYYTTNGSNPDPESNAANTYKYTGPIDMPEGSTIFSFVLMDQKGRLSDVTKRNYELVYSE